MNNKIVNFFLSLVSLLFIILLLEVGARVYKSTYCFKNFRGETRDLLRSAYPSEFNKELGWIPKEGSFPRNVWNANVNILQDGIRSNGDNNHKEQLSNGIILAVGDSFTFGDEVSDNETWPAILEKLSNTRVINGGVFGYGVDQSYLRMKILASKYQPDIIIFSFISFDIQRCELSERTSVPKPYFELSNSDKLVLKNEHIPSSLSLVNQPDLFQRVLGYSFFVHKLMLKAFPDYWIPDQKWRNKQVHSNGAKVACHIFREIAQFSKKNKIKIYILAQYTKIELERDMNINMINVINCIDRDVLQLIDLRHLLNELKKYDRNRYESLYVHHMTKEGNFFVASELYEEIIK